MSLDQRFKPRLRWLKFIVPLLVITGGIAFIVLKPVPVAVHEVKSGKVLAEVMGTGTLTARIKAALSPRIQGRLAELLVDQNDTVRTGQLLARLDDGDLLQSTAMATRRSRHFAALISPCSAVKSSPCSGR